jgi:hypothetical protein
MYFGVSRDGKKCISLSAKMFVSKSGENVSGKQSLHVRTSGNPAFFSWYSHPPQTNETEKKEKCARVNIRKGSSSSLFHPTTKSIEPFVVVENEKSSVTNDTTTMRVCIGDGSFFGPAPARRFIFRNNKQKVRSNGVEEKDYLLGR